MTSSLCFPKRCSSLVAEYFLCTSLVASKQLCHDIIFPISFAQLVKISAKNWTLSELARPEPHKQVKVKNPSELLKCFSWYCCNEIQWQRKPLKVLFIFYTNQNNCYKVRNYYSPDFSIHFYLFILIKFSGSWWSRTWPPGGQEWEGKLSKVENKV